MKKLFSILLLFLAVLTANAQPGDAKAALLTLKTFKADGTTVAESYACMINSDGTTISSWTPFDGADSAVVVDARGVSHQVEKIYGANELYNLVKFQIANAAGVKVIDQAKSTPRPSARLWVMAKKPLSVNLQRSEKFMNKYNYYVLGDKMELKNDRENYPDGAPVVDESGALVGVYYYGSSVLSATDYRYAEALKPSNFAAIDPVLRRTSIRKALPDDFKEAQLSLMAASQDPVKDHLATALDFIKMFPKANDGYYDVANIYVAQGKVADADRIMQEAISKADDKAQAHYNYARLIWQKNALQPQLEYAPWTYDKAVDETDKAYKISPQPIYDEMKAKIDYSRGNYQDAYDRFIALTKSSLRNPELFFEAAQSKSMMKAPDSEILTLLDSAVAVCDTPYTQIAAPYFYARGYQNGKMGNYRNAMIDLYRYEALSVSRQPASFYFDREQFEMKGRLFQNALADISAAILTDPRNAVYWTEKANIHLRVNQFDDAIKSADMAIKADSTYGTGYLVKGLAQCQSGKKDEGVANLKKAKELGDTQADEFLKKY